MKHLYFVRHGLTVMNQQGLFSGATDTPLNEEGVAQAHAAGKRLKDTGIDCIVSSPYKRTLDTAEIIASEIGFDPSKIITHEIFVERDFGPLEGTEYSTTAPLDTTEGVEHSRDLIARIAEGWKYLQSLDADTILVVSHGAVGRALRCVIEEDTPFHKSERFQNAQVVKLI